MIGHVAAARRVAAVDAHQAQDHDGPAQHGLETLGHRLDRRPPRDRHRERADDADTLVTAGDQGGHGSFHVAQCAGRRPGPANGFRENRPPALPTPCPSPGPSGEDAPREDPRQRDRQPHRQVGQQQQRARHRQGAQVGERAAGA
ncbi:hypothetical protein ACLQ2R_10505 [Streptosporangium sp. DT93]|uniref:hypothetical protein n=1 Tax=Streptosporangium sp. DT93 TaxID=3393428 RepID=UPI003CEE7B72